MKTLLLIGIACAVLLAAGCRDREAEAREAKAAAEAKARAEASRKEMEALPKTFKSRDIFKKNEPAKAVPPAPPQEKPKP